jgi:hypothetical protein
MEQHTKDAILDIVQPAYIEDVREAVEGRRAWKKLSDFCEGSSKILAGVANILAFSSGVYDFRELSFASGCVGTASIVLSVFASYASGESRERTIRLNTTLDHVGLKRLGMPAFFKSDEQHQEKQEEQEIQQGKVATLARHYEKTP